MEKESETQGDPFLYCLSVLLQTSIESPVLIVMGPIKVKISSNKLLIIIDEVRYSMEIKT